MPYQARSSASKTLKAERLRAVCRAEPSRVGADRIAVLVDVPYGHYGK